MCPDGVFSATPGSSNATCSGVCPAGYYCTGGTQQSCGAVSKYCPEGSTSASVVTVGHYTVDVDGGTTDQLHRVAQVACEAGHWCAEGVRSECPAGRYGSALLLQDANCSGVCNEGYYCPAGSSSPLQHPCGGPHVYCPEGSGAPTTVGSGFYSTGGSSSSTRTGEARCEAGFYCSGGVRLACKEGHYGESPGQTEDTCSGECPVGTTW